MYFPLSDPELDEHGTEHEMVTYQSREGAHG